MSRTRAEIGNIFLLCIVGSAAALAASCGGKGGPTSPSPNQNQLFIPPADASKYLSIPIEKHLDETERCDFIGRCDTIPGRKTKMWVKLTRLTPPPGSKVVTDPNTIQCLPPRSGNCLQMFIELGMEQTPDGLGAAQFRIGFSQDGENFSAPGSIGSADLVNQWVAPGASVSRDVSRGLDFLPKYLLILGESSENPPAGQNHVIRTQGTTTIILDYQPM